MSGPSAASEDPGPTGTGLVTGLQRRDPKIWHQFVVLYGPLIYGWLRRAGLRTEDAADVSQEVFRAVAAGATHLRHGRPGDTFRGWLWTVTRSKIADFWRQRAGRPMAVGGTSAQELLLLVEESTPESRSEVATESAGVIRRAVELVRSEFEPRSWDAFWRSVVEVRPVGDVARDLGLTPNAVYVARSRILRRLRDLLAGDAGAPACSVASPCR